ncbi:Uncharacterized protein dnm_038530 [Desulfonema magnum]|uniref:Uncharacterized protein n=1 Tax=Desulfonema magnum TaxID=45655 RepID=A0A975BLT6_9BACT|nr:Uncharacterized protein dnm_038530 [Desulfonema magnum]
MPAWHDSDGIGREQEQEQEQVKVRFYACKNFLYISFSVNSGETRLFPSEAADRSWKKAGFLPLTNIENLWSGTYLYG